jgi:hypothetical protein
MLGVTHGEVEPDYSAVAPPDHIRSINVQTIEKLSHVIGHRRIGQRRI